MITREIRQITRKRNLSRNLFCATRRIIAGKLFDFFILILASFRVFSGLTSFPLSFVASASKINFSLVKRIIILALFCGLVAFGGAAELYHTNRTFTAISFNLQGIPTMELLDVETAKLTNIVKGLAIQLNSNETYAIEKQAAIPICYGSVEEAWNAAVAYNGSSSNYLGKIFDNVGWVRGTKSDDGEWGAYLWTLQNRIAFKSSATNMWVSNNGIPVAITNVMVGSLGDYGPMEDIVDIGPDISLATNFPGEGESDSGTYYVDITNVYYQLVTPGIWITPRDVVVAVGSSNAVRFTVTGTNITNGVNWSINPSGLSGGAEIQSNSYWYYRDVIPGNVATNYLIRATSAANTSLYDEVSLTILKVEFKEYASCSGFDPTLDPPWLMVPFPAGNNNKAKAEITPSGSAGNVNFESADEGKATVAPATASTSLETVTVTSVAKGETEVRAKVGADTCASMGISVKDKLNKTIAIHAITEENDDVQAIPVGQGQPNQTCITAGTNGVLDSSAGGDDVTNANTIVTGPNGICNTTASGDDVQVIAVGNGKLNAICVGKGGNNFRDTPNPSGDDVVNGDDIDTGADGICNTTANNQNLAPNNVPSAAELQDYLNNTTWGKQANVYFVVTCSNATVNYDLNRDGGCADSPFTEIETIDTTAKDPTVDFNVYYVKTMEVPNASTRIATGYSWIGDSHDNSTVNITAHETGHLLSIETDSSNIEDLMLSYSSSANPTRVIKNDWDKVNP